jgi:hypothetical protein
MIRYKQLDLPVKLPYIAGLISQYRKGNVAGGIVGHKSPYSGITAILKHAEQSAFVIVAKVKAKTIDHFAPIEAPFQSGLGLHYFICH